MKNFLSVVYGVLCILGCLLGAGFVSGAEVQTFFVQFGHGGIVGIVLSSIIFAITVCKQGGNAQHKSIQKINILPYCQLLISGAMFAGLSEVVLDMMQINKVITIACLGVLLFIALVFGIKFANVFNIIVSVATVIVLPIVFKNVGGDFSVSANSNFGLGAVYALLYATINIVACMPVIECLPAKNKKIVGVFSAIITAVLLGGIFVMLSANNTDHSMPVLQLINSLTLKGIYTVLFVVAMVSTLFSASNGAKQVFAKMQSNVFVSACTSVAIATLSFIGFGGIINYLYPAIGIAIFIQIAVNKLYKNSLKTQKCAIYTQK